MKKNAILTFTFTYCPAILKVDDPQTKYTVIEHSSEELTASTTFIEIPIPPFLVKLELF